MLKDCSHQCPWQLLLRRAGYAFHTTAEREVTRILLALSSRWEADIHSLFACYKVVRSIKEDICYVAFNPAKEEQLEEQRLAHSTSSSLATASASLHSYTLPDGNTLQVLVLLL